MALLIKSSAVTSVVMNKILNCVCQQIRKQFNDDFRIRSVEFNVYKSESSKIDEEILSKSTPYNEKSPKCQRMNEFLSHSLKPITITGDVLVIEKQEVITSVPIMHQPSLNSFVLASFDPNTRHLEKIKKIARELDDKYDNYSEHPETHPNYKTEWGKWYLKQKSEIAKGGIKVQEWIKYWKDRANMLKLKEFRKIEAELRIKDEEKEKFDSKVVEGSNLQCDVSERDNELTNSTATVENVQSTAPETSPASPPPVQQNYQDDKNDKEEECMIIEQERVMIEVSDEEDSTAETQSPKRQKLASPEQQHQELLTTATPTFSSQPKKLASARETMIVAIQLAHQMLLDNRQPEPEELEKLVKIYFDDREDEDNDQDDEELFDFSALSNNDFIVLYKNFGKLMPAEQDNYMEALSLIEKQQPERFKIISEEVKKTQQN